jgi:hypothetical protein
VTVGAGDENVGLHVARDRAEFRGVVAGRMPRESFCMDVVPLQPPDDVLHPVFRVAQFVLGRKLDEP